MLSESCSASRLADFEPPRAEGDLFLIGDEALVQADARATYARELVAVEVYKDCCVRSPGHTPPHDVVDRLDH